MTYGELTYIEKSDLLDFWRFCESCNHEMLKNCEGNPDRLHLPNQMICYAFAAAVWKDHLKAVDWINRKYEIEERFVKEHGKEMDFFSRFHFSTKPSEMMWYGGAVVNAIKDSPFDDQEKFLGATESDFLALPKIGKKKIKYLKRTQETIAAHREFFSKHPDFEEKVGNK